MKRSDAITLVAAKAALGATMALGIVLAPSGHAAPPNEDDPGVSSQSDGTSSGAIQEDDPRWSCVDDGNRVCGPGNSNGVPAGCYDDGGVMFKAWPCEAWMPSDGYRHGDGSISHS